MEERIEEKAFELEEGELEELERNPGDDQRDGEAGYEADETDSTEPESVWATWLPMASKRPWSKRWKT